MDTSETASSAAAAFASQSDDDAKAANEIDRSPDETAVAASRPIDDQAADDHSTTDHGTAFSNDPIEAGGLPHLDEQPFASLDPAYARVRSTSAALVAAAIVVAAVIGAFVLASQVPLIVGGSLVVFVGAIGIVQRLETNHMGYLVREHDVSFCSGVIGRSVATAPFARVQHVSIERGPIDRRFGLAALQLRTAGGHIAIPGLRHDVAERLKQLVGDRSAALADAEVDNESTIDPDAA